VGDSVTVRSTAGTAFDAEVPCTMVDPEFGDIIELPIGHTAWWPGHGDETAEEHEARVGRS